MRKLAFFAAMLLISILFSACLADEAETSVHLNGTNPPETQETEAPTQETEATVPPTQATEITEPPTEPPTQPTEQTQPPTEPSTQPTDPETGLPVYVPGSIELSDMSDWYPFDRKYRYCYYSIKGPFLNLLNEEQKQDFYVWADETAKDTNYGEFRNEMVLVAVVKRYNIPREAFEEALKTYLSRRSEDELKNEYWEAPNADIIYTFDNEIINEYYRYE